MEVVDLHVHGIEGLDTNGTDADTMLRIAALHGQAGVSKLLLSIYPASIHVMRAHMAAVQAAMERQQIRNPKSDIRNFDSSALILGVHLEGPFLNPLKSGALDPAALIAPDHATLDRLLDGFEHMVRTMTVAPELPGAEGLIRSLTDRGILVNMGHSDATYAEAEAGFRAGARGITHLFNAMRGFHHRESGIAGFGLLHKEVYVEIIGDLRHLNLTTLELVFRIKNPARIILVSDAVAGTRAVAEPVPKRDDDELLGGAMPLPAAASALVTKGLDQEAVTQAISTNPTKYLKLLRPPC